MTSIHTPITYNMSTYSVKTTKAINNSVLTLRFAPGNSSHNRRIMEAFDICGQHIISASIETTEVVEPIIIAPVTVPTIADEGILAIVTADIVENVAYVVKKCAVDHQIQLYYDEQDDEYDGLISRNNALSQYLANNYIEVVVNKYKAPSEVYHMHMKYIDDICLHLCGETVGMGFVSRLIEGIEPNYSKDEYARVVGPKLNPVYYVKIIDRYVRIGHIRKYLSSIGH